VNTARAALVISILACVGAWVGPAVARSLIHGSDIARNTVTGRNVARLSGRDVVANGIDGSDIDEQSLDQVPNALHANGADHVNGVDFDRFNYADPKGAQRVLFNRGGLTIAGLCDNGDLRVVATTASDGALLRIAVTTPDTPTQVQADNDFTAQKNYALLPGQLNNAFGTLVYTVPNGPTVTVNYLAQDGLPASTGHQCVIGGSAVISKP
jgi:hypothetical protein